MRYVEHILCLLLIVQTRGAFQVNSHDNDIQQKYGSYFDNPRAISWIQMKIKNNGSKDKFPHRFPPPSTAYMDFSSIFEKDFLHQVLHLLDDIRNVTSNFLGKTIKFNDICYKGKGDNSCYFNSLLQYYGFNHSAIDRTVWDEYRFYIEWDYLDHFLKCSSDLTTGYDHTINITCKDVNDHPVLPQSVLEEYDGVNFQNATTLVVSMLFKTEGTYPSYPDEVLNWQYKMWSFVQDYNNPNISASIVTSNAYSLPTDKTSTLFFREKKHPNAYP